MTRKGLIKAGRCEDGLGYGLLPFVVGIYEMQAAEIDEELAQLFEDYYVTAFGQALSIQPSFHRVVPVHESIPVDIELQPFESVHKIVSDSEAWGVIDCICRKQKELLGDPCEHPLDVCMVLGRRPGAFNNSPWINALSKEDAFTVLQRAADAGLVHSVSNNQADMGYICNCCTCSCGILRGISDLGLANVIAQSPFVNSIDDSLCIGCEICIDTCQFSALELEDDYCLVDQMRCVGCGVCVPFCEESALALILRPQGEIPTIPITKEVWDSERAAARGIDLSEVL